MRKTGSVECPTTCVRQTLALGEVELRLLTLFYFEIDTDPTEQRSIALSHGLGSTQEPPVSTFSITNAKGNLASSAGAKTRRPDPACLFVIFWMQHANVGIPLFAEVNSITKGMVPWQP